MDYIVDQKLNEWQVHNIDPESENYITQDAQIACVEYIIKKTITEMTPVCKDILSVGYPMETQEEMIETIKNRAKLAVLSYTIQQNTPKEEGEAIKNINAF